MKDFKPQTLALRKSRFMSRPIKTRHENLTDLHQHPWYRKQCLKLSQEDLKKLAQFITDNDHLNKDQFAKKAHLAFPEINKKSLLLSELLLVINQ